MNLLRIYVGEIDVGEIDLEEINIDMSLLSKCPSHFSMSALFLLFTHV